MLTHLDHVVIAVADLDEATRTTASLLGRGPSWRGEHPDHGTANTLFRLDNTYLELLAPAGEGALADALRKRLGSAGEGLAALAFGTTDAEACRQGLADRGLHPGPAQEGMGRDVQSGAFRQWRSVMLPPAETGGVTLFAIEHRSPEGLLAPAPAAGEPAAAVHALDHVVVRTADAEAARALYGDALGLRLALDRRFEQWGVRLLFFRIGGLTVELAAALAGSGEREPRDELWGLSYRVADVAAAQSRLARAGFDVSEVRAGRKPGTRVCTVRGEPSGVATLLIEPAAG